MADRVRCLGSDGFELLLSEERVRLFSSLWLITRDRHEAEDVAQEAFVRVWERWERHGAPDDPAVAPRSVPKGGP